MYLDAAVNIVQAEGEAALSMKRLTTELETATGGIFRYFPTRDELLTAVRYELVAPVQQGADDLDAAIADLVDRAPVDAQAASLSRVIGSCRFWTSAAISSPHAVELARQLIAARTVASRRGVPAASPADPLVDRLARHLDDAADMHAIDRGDPIPRAALAIDVSTAPVLTACLSADQADRDDSPHLAGHLLDALLALWGADPDTIEDACAILAQLDPERDHHS